jgi:TrkA domain protein
MPVEIRQTRLPGVGTKFSFVTARGARAAVIQHVDGTRELYVFRRRADDEPAVVLQLEDDEARQLGAVLGGAYERPQIVEELEMVFGELAIEWVEVPDESPAIGKTLAECAFRARTGITVIAILREPEPVVGAQPNDRIEHGDTLVTVGRLGQYPAFRRLLAEGPMGDADSSDQRREGS